MEELTQWVTVHAQHAHWIIFGLLMLAGLNIPISEDVLLISGGMIAHTLPVQEVAIFYSVIFIGCWISAWEAYWLGRLLGPRLLKIRWLCHTLTPDRVERIGNFYRRRGFITLLVGRFIPFGARNAIFMTAGLSRTPFLRFIARDLIPCLLSTSLLFFLSLYLGKKSSVLYDYLHVYEQTILLVFAVIGLAALGGWLIRYRRRARQLQTS